MEVVGWLVDSVRRCGVVEIPPLGSSPLIKSREARKGNYLLQQRRSLSPVSTIQRSYLIEVA